MCTHKRKLSPHSNAAMGLVADFLDRTSIHGLRYLSNAETRGNPVVAAVWLVCIAGSFTAAAVVIYYNVHNWENSPSIISKAQPVLIEVKLTR